MCRKLDLRAHSLLFLRPDPPRTIAEFPPAEVLVQLAQALDVSADELLGLDKPKSKMTPKQDPETKRLWKKFQQLIDLPEKDRRAVIRLLNSLGANSKIRNSAA